MEGIPSWETRRGRKGKRRLEKRGWVGGRDQARMKGGEVVRPSIPHRKDQGEKKREV